MPKPEERGGLINLKAPSLPKPAHIPTATPEMEGQILNGDAHTAEPPSTRIDVSEDDREREPGKRKREPTVSMNAKLPFGLHERLKHTAQFNDVSMTDILIRGIEAELYSGRYTRPPENWGPK